MVPLLNEGTQSASPELARAEVFSGTPQAAALLLRDAVRSCASQERPVQVATAESLTGGDVGGAICTVPGASAYYRGGVISYAYEEMCIRDRVRSCTPVTSRWTSCLWTVA